MKHMFVRAAAGGLAALMLGLNALAAGPLSDIGSASLLRNSITKTALASSVKAGASLNEDEAAVRLYFLGLITGTGTAKDGSVTFDLHRDLTRLEAVVMAARLMASEEKLSVCTHPYTDVPEWASGYVGYLYSCGLLENAEDGLFHPQSAASAPMFMSYMLYALGFRMQKGDYNLLTVMNQTRLAGICDLDAEEPLTRGGAVVAMYNTLRASIKGSDRMLSALQVETGKLNYTDAVFLLWSDNIEETKTYMDAVGYSSEWIVPDGYYTIRAADGSDMVMNVLANGTNQDYEGLGLTLWNDTGDISQSFRLERTERETYLVYASCSRGGFYRLLGLSNNGAKVGLYRPTSKNALEFYIRQEENGIWIFVTRTADGTEKYLRSGVGGYNGTMTLTDDVTAATRWILEKQGITNSAGEDLALFPADSMRITQGAYGTYSHQKQNAIDMQPTNSMAFAPFNATVVRKDNGYYTCNGVWIQSTDKVRYADGSYDYMTVLFMHDDYIDDLTVGQALVQGEYFYHSGTTGNSTGAHIHMAVYRGKYSSTMRFASGDIYAEDAFFVLDDTVIRNDFGLDWVSVSEAE